jgi:hypothetical protein
MQFVCDSAASSESNVEGNNNEPNKHTCHRPTNRHRRSEAADFGSGWRGFVGVAAVTLGRRKGAYVFDIDATLLSAKAAPPFRGPQDIPAADAWGNAGIAEAIEVTRPLYEKARHKGYEIHFITARSPSTREGTVRNLQQAGFGNFHSLVMKPNGIQPGSFKAAARKALFDQGLEVLVNVGDADSDFEGGWFHRGLKVIDESELAPYVVADAPKSGFIAKFGRGESEALLSS